jgi:predicted acyltransferase
MIAPSKRAYALDALRGFAILAMVLSGTIAYKILPAWMYHAQVPPPDHVFNPKLPGLTWVDLVFPIFLFSMGAAIPLALSRRLAKGWPKIRVILSILKRGFLLGAFAIILQHLRPQVINPNPSTQKWQIALLGFFLLFFMFVRPPASWKPWIRNAITLSAWIAAIFLLAIIQYPDKSGFSVSRSDIILIVLANMAVFGAIIWLFTRQNIFLRVGLLGLLFAIQLSSTADGWVAQLWSYSPAPWIFKFAYLKYLFIVIPGTVAGDLILESMQTTEYEQKESWKTWRFDTIVLLMLALNLILLVGLQSRLVLQTTLATAILCSIGWFLFKHPTSATERLLNRLYSWGILWLAIGLVFEPYEGGIKKDPSTMSYYFVTTGMSIFILIAFTIIFDIFPKKYWLNLLIDNGQNPMIGYVGFANLLWPILALTGWEESIIKYTQTPVMGFMKGVGYTLVIALVVSGFTRLKLFWRT